jgi:oligopeptide transport system ATP-binding protein
MTTPLLQVRDLVKHFPIKRDLLGRPTRVLKAVDGVSFDVHPGETLGLVGESGCGKTTAGRTVIKLYEPDAGSIIFDGTDLAPLKPVAMQPFRRRIQMIFQDPYASLDPRMTVEDIVTEGMGAQLGRSERRDLVRDLLRQVGLAAEHAQRFPHEFSGGQRQRIGIARALAVDPDLVVCDEPISALDVSIQAQVVNMLEDLQQQRGLTLLFIAHDLSMVKHISDRIGVMYLGKLVEIGPSRDLYRHPHHPYTQALLSAVPVPNPRKARARQRRVLQGDVPSPIDLPSGCRFRGRCPYAMPRCAEEEPPLREVASGQWSACWLDDEHAGSTPKPPPTTMAADDRAAPSLPISAGRPSAT